MGYCVYFFKNKFDCSRLHLQYELLWQIWSSEGVSVYLYISSAIMSIYRYIHADVALYQRNIYLEFVFAIVFSSIFTMIAIIIAARNRLFCIVGPLLTFDNYRNSVGHAQFCAHAKLATLHTQQGYSTSLLMVHNKREKKQHTTQKSSRLCRWKFESN